MSLRVKNLDAERTDRSSNLRVPIADLPGAEPVWGRTKTPSPLCRDRGH